ncbi:MAG: hypothetical protein IT249_04050 [Chitinophagaceae bacterium]|nr:hypothetical protein [Chitinophagaceae bacterium]
MKAQLNQINNLLQNSDFTRAMAEKLEAAYYIAQNQPVPPFSTPFNDTALIKKSIKEEKIATGVAPLYAVECGIGQLMEASGGTPVEWVDKIINNKLDSAQVLILNRFANATWKAGQPFRGLERIKRPVFISAVFLPEDEVKKDYEHVQITTQMLREKMENVKDASKSQQLQRINELLQDKQFAFDVAANAEVVYYTSQRKAVPPFLKPGEDTATHKKSMLDEKVAINVAGFYALECGLSYLATAKNALPSKVLHDIVTGSLAAPDKKLFQRFANATWKAGQPFRELDRITRDNFISFDLLPAEEVNKDWIQIKAAAEKLSPLIK